MRRFWSPQRLEGVSDPVERRFDLTVGARSERGLSHILKQFPSSIESVPDGIEELQGRQGALLELNEKLPHRLLSHGGERPELCEVRFETIRHSFDVWLRAERLVGEI